MNALQLLKERELRVQMAGPDLLQINNQREPWKRTGTGG